MDAGATLQDAQQRLARGDIHGARRAAERIVADAGNTRQGAQAHLLLAACAHQEKNHAAGLRHVSLALQGDPDNAAGHYLNAELLEGSGDARAAMASLRRAVALQPSFTQAWFYLGILEGEQGNHAGAVQAFESTVRIDPTHARAWNNLGNALRGLGRVRDALAAFERAVAARPEYWLAVANLAKALRDLGEVERAESVLRGALAHPSAQQQPFRPLLVLLAGLTRERGFLDESAQLYWRAIQAAPAESAGEWFNLGWVLGERGDPEKARDAYARSYALDRRELRALCGSHLVLPMIHADAASLERAREGYVRGLAALDSEMDAAVAGLTAADVLDGFRWANFFLAYQGRDDCALQARYAATVARAIDLVAPEWRRPLSAPPARGPRIRIGFASAFLHVGTVGRYFRSWITELPRERFEVFVYHLWPGMDEVAQAVRERADTFRTFGGSDARPSVVAPAIRDDRLDLLVYPELGMDVTSFALAALRLAPRQLAAWGHPVTTGHRTIDAFISCEGMEPPGATAHYTERLILLPGIGTRYQRPDVPQGAGRAALGLPEDRVLLLCPQSLFKIHPDNDALFADVLDHHPDTLLVLFAGRHPAITDLFMRRLERSFEPRDLDVRARVRVLPSLPHADFMRVNLSCDLMLDTLHWSGGNTSLDALACGLPVVTLPGAYMRGRQSAAMLRLLGADELVARDRSDYLAIASRIIHDASWRQSLAMRIRDAQPQLFGRTDALQRLVEIFEAEAARPV